MNMAILKSMVNAYRKARADVLSKDMISAFFGDTLSAMMPPGM